MNRIEKQQVIESVKQDFANNQAAFIVNMQGMTVSAIQNLRRQLYDRKGKIVVVKNTLLIKATDSVPGLKDLAPHFKDQIAIVFAGNEGPAIAKVLQAVAKEHEALKLKAGAFDARLITAAQVEALANMPSREVLLAMLAGTLQAPTRNLVTLLNQLIVRLLWVLKEIEKKKQA